MSTENFVNDFHKKFPILESLDWSNLAIRGGTVIDVLLGRPPSDVDFFIYGLPTPEAFVKRANDLVGWFLQVERDYVEEQIQKDKEVRELFKKTNGYDYPTAIRPDPNFDQGHSAGAGRDSIYIPSLCPRADRPDGVQVD